VRGSSLGKLFSITSFGESHGEALGAVIDGVPAGLMFSLQDLQYQLDRRAPGNIKGTTSRKEPDTAEVLSGIFKQKTMGTPIAVIIRNTDQRSKDYDKIKTDPRPGHADQTYNDKYGIRDHRGGGRSSGRETVSRVIGGYFAGLIIKNIRVRAYIREMGPFHFQEKLPHLNADLGPYSFPDLTEIKNIEKYLIDLKKNGESVGGRISIQVDDCPKGLGEPAFDKLKADLAKGLMSIGAVVSFSYGLGEEFAEISGKEASSSRLNFGGIEGGISNGDPLFLTITLKPTSTVGDKAKEGRHDPCILPRAIPVAEAMVKIILADHFLRQNAYQY
jgi:chorismate synthase